MAKYTNQDIKFIAQHMRDTKLKGQTIALLTGAGCSKSAEIPLASELVAEINDKNKPYHHYLRDLDDQQRQDYGHCMNAIDRDMRNDLLKPYLENAKVNWSHIAIALLIKEGFVGRVLTFNFDNVLSRACGLCGEYPATYDYAASFPKSCKHIASPSIIHLHGQGTGMLMLNDKQETDEHVKNIEPLLLNTLENYPLLVTGYSGISDPVFAKLSELYSKDKKIHWCDYSEEPKSHIAEFLNQYPNNVYHYGGVNSDYFLLRIAQELKCFESCIFTDPVGHLRDEIKDVTPFPNENENSKVEYDPFNKLQKILDGFEEYVKSNGDKNNSSDLEKLFIKGKYQEIIDFYESSDKESVDVNIVSDAYFYLALVEDDVEKKCFLNQRAVEINSNHYSALSNWGAALSRNQEYEKACEKYQQSIGIKSDQHEVFNNWGISLGQLKKYDEACEKFRQATRIKPDKSEAFYNWGVTLDKVKKFEEACEKYQLAVQIKPDEYDAINNWGISLGKLKQYDEACKKFLEVVTIKSDHYVAFNNWGVTLTHLEDYEKACEKFEEAIALKPDEADAWYNWAAALYKLERYDEVCDKYQQVIAIEAEHYQAFHNWGVALNKLSKYEEACSRFRKALAIKPDYEDAFNSWINSLIGLFHGSGKKNYLDEALDKIEKLLIMGSKEIYNAACVAALMENEKSCQQYLFTCRDAGTLPDLKHLKNDADLDYVRDKEWFKVLLDELFV